MAIEGSDIISYLSNLILIARADNALSPREQGALEEIRTAIGAKKSELSRATKLVESSSYTLTKVRRFSDQIRNLEDMLYLCLVDGELADDETKIITEYCKLISISQEQLDLLVSEADQRGRRHTATLICPSCSQSAPAQAKFCPHCAQSFASVESDSAVKVSMEIPATGYAVEFCESTVAGFPRAVEIAKAAPFFTSCVRSGKTWYLASWPGDRFEEVVSLAETLKGIRNRRVHIDGQETSWDEVFEFMWCASRRKAAYQQTEYCFGKDENRLNLWGCKQLRLDWDEWGDWFSYGSFRKSGLLRNQVAWVFDKKRIRHELNQNAHAVRFCPHLRPALISAVVDALPEEVVVSGKGPWKYKDSGEEVPGAIKVIEKDGDDEYASTNEYWSDGVVPRGLDAARHILAKAFQQARIADVTVRQLTT